LHVLHEALADFRVDSAQDIVPPVHENHMDIQRCEHRGILATDDAST
jgi:hypothetical protein